MATKKATASDAPVEIATEPETLAVSEAVEIDTPASDAPDAVDSVEIALSVRPAQDGLPAFPL